jgi:hypothetical protein
VGGMQYNANRKREREGLKTMKWIHCKRERERKRENGEIDK